MYRIKVTRTPNGDKRYTPQEGYVRKYGAWNPQKEIVWLNLHEDYTDFEKESTAKALLGMYKSHSVDDFRAKLMLGVAPWEPEETTISFNHEHRR